MKFLDLHQDDAKWLRRWMRSNLVCVLGISCFLVALRDQTSLPFVSLGQLQADQLVAVRDETGVPTGDKSSTLPPETELVLLDKRRPNPVAPTGWRRTAQGWEDVSTWRPAPRPLGEIIATQVDREPVWAREILGRLRGVPPLMFAMVQITAIAAIVRFAKNRDDVARQTQHAS